MPRPPIPPTVSPSGVPHSLGAAMLGANEIVESVRPIMVGIFRPNPARLGDPDLLAESIGFDGVKKGEKDARPLTVGFLLEE